VPAEELARAREKLAEAEDWFRTFRITERGDVSEGQATLVEMIEEIHQMIHDLAEEAVLLAIEGPEPVDAALLPLKEKLEGIVERLETLKTKPVAWVTAKDIGHEQVRLHEVDEQYDQAKFKKAGKIPQGQAAVSELLETAHALAREILLNLPEEESDPEMRIHGKFRHMVHRIRKIIGDLKALKQREFSLRDLGRLQNRLSYIDAKYENSRFQFGAEIPEGQAYASELLEIAHGLVEDLHFEMEKPEKFSEYELVSPELLPVLLKLEHYEDLLKTMMSVSVDNLSTRDIGRVQNSLSKIDKRYSQAKLSVGGKIPAGQAITSEKLNRVHELVHLVLSRIPMEDSELVDDSLHSVLNKLDKLTVALMKLKATPSEYVTTEDIGYIQNRLSDIDKRYTQTKYTYAGTAPKGQAIISEKLCNAHELAHELLVRQVE
jgi:hypothetical protein